MKFGVVSDYSKEQSKFSTEKENKPNLNKLEALLVSYDCIIVEQDKIIKLVI